MTTSTTIPPTTTTTTIPPTTTTTTVPPTTTTTTIPPTTTTTIPTTTTTEPPELLPAPRVLGVPVCVSFDDGACSVAVVHSAVEGAVRYVVERVGGREAPCSTDVLFLCLAVFPGGAPGCATLRAVDADGTRGLRSSSFCVDGPPVSARRTGS